MKQLALVLSILLLLSLTSGAFAVDQKQVQNAKQETLLPVAKNLQAKQGPSATILGESNIFEENFEGDLSGWFNDGGYGSADGGTPAVMVHPALWEVSMAKANSPTHSLFHPDEFDVSRSFTFSPAFTIPADVNGEPVVSAKVNFQLNIDNPGYGDPTGATTNLADYFMVYAGHEDTQFAVVDVEGNKVYFSGYPEANSFQYLTSPKIDLTAAVAPVELSFKYLMINEKNWDLGRVDILVDGMPGYEAVAQMDESAGFMDMTVDLSAYAGKMIQVRFAFLPDDGTNVANGGLWLDEIKVKDANGDLLKDDAEEGNAVMAAFGVTVDRLFYDYDRVGDAGAAFHLWDETGLFNGTADLFDLGFTAGQTAWLAFRYISDGDNTQGEETSAGMFVDDIAVTAISGVPADAAVSALTLGYPRTAEKATPIAATVSNFGFEAQEIALWYKFDDAAGKPVPPRLSLPAFYDSLRIFPVNMPNADSTLFTAYTMLNGDANPDNDGLSEMVYVDAPGTATFSYYNGNIASYTTTNRIVMYDPLAALAGVEKYDVKSVEIYMYNPTGTPDQVNIKVATWTDDPTVPVEILADQNVEVNTAGIVPVKIDVNKMGITDKLALWFDFTASAKKTGPLLDTITPFKGNEIFYNAAAGTWGYSGRGTMAFVNVAYALPATMLTTFEEDFDAPVDVPFWTPNTSTLADGTPVFAVTQEMDALKVVMNQANFFDGQMYDWMKTNEYFDLTANPLWSMMIKVMPGATYTKDGKATVITEVPFSGSPFLILKDKAGLDSLVRQHSNPTVKVPADGEWHNVMFDWSVADTDPQYPNDFTMITRLLLESVAWPGTHQATFYIDDVKVGDAAVPPVPPLPQVFHASHPPAIDGKLDPIWEMAEWTREYVTPGGTPAFNNAALSWRAMWDNEYLYLFISVVDDIFISDTPNTWQGDSIELWLDGDNSKAAAYDGVNDLGYGFKYSNDPANPLIFSPGGEWRMGTTGHKESAAWTDMGVDLELAIPMKNLGLTPAAGNLLGMDMDWNDNDLGGGRANKVKWFDATDNSWQYPNLMGTIQLAERTIYDYADIWYTATTPVIDGNPDDMLVDLPSFPLNHYLGSADSIKSFTDLALEYKTVWDENYLYYFIDVKDDVLNTAGVYNWTDDGIELWFDGDNSKKGTYDGINDAGFEFLYMQDAALDSFYFFDGGANYVKFDPASLMRASKRTKDGVYLEFAIPMDSLGIKPVNGWKIGHEIDYNDSDTPGLDRDTKCKTYAEQDNTWNTPSAFGTGMFMGGPGAVLPEAPKPLMIDMTAVPPVIDGTMDRMWENAINYQVAKFRPDDWWDSYGNFRVLYDAKNFYMFIEVHDDVINTEHANDYERDCVELFLDGNNSKNPIGTDPWAWPPTAFDIDDAQFRFIFDAAPWVNKEGYDLSGIEYAFLQTDTGWNLEFLMPWKGQPFKGAADLKIGFDVSIGDNDGANRENVTNWWADNGEAWHDPSAFGTAQFTARKINEKTTKYEWDRLLPIPFTAYPVKIDGEADYGWDSVSPVFSNMRMNNSGNKDYLVGPLDGQVEWKAAWDYNNLYLLIDVTDDVFLQEGSKSWQDDGVEIWFDGNASMLPAYTDANDVSFGMTYNADTILDRITNWRGALPAEKMDLIQQAQKLTDHGMMVELALPMSVLGVEAADGSLVAIEVDYNDSDTPGLDRDTKIKSYDPTDNTWQNPSLLGMARLVGSVLKSDVEDNVETVVEYELNQNYPNPFNPSTTIEFALPTSGKVKLAVYDILGREVMTLVDTKMEAGRHSATFDASRLSSGVYFYRLQTSERIFTKKMMLIK